MGVNDFNLFPNLAGVVQLIARPGGEFFRVSGVVPDDLPAYLPGIETWGVFWREDHTVFRCERGQAGHVVKLLDKVGLNYTTSYQPAKRARRKRDGFLATLKGLW